MEWQDQIKQEITAVCEVCNTTKTDVAETLHSEGWDAPPYFDAYVTCPNCRMTDTYWWARVKEHNEN